LKKIIYIELNYKKYIENIKYYFENQYKEIIFKQRNEVRSVYFNSEDKEFVVKKFKVPHILNRIIYKYIRDSKAESSYKNSLKLLKLNVNVPKPIGFCIEENFFIISSSYYVSENIIYEFDIRYVLENKYLKNRNQILKEFIKFSFELHNKGINHLDYSPGNIIIKVINDNHILKYKFYILDLNRVRFEVMDIEKRIGNLSKLTNNKLNNYIIINEYSKLIKKDRKYIKKIYDKYKKKEIKYLKMKKRIKEFLL